MEGYTFTVDPPKAVTDYLANKGLTPSFSWLDIWAEEHAFAFTVAKATELTLLSDIFEEIQSSIADGTPFAEFKKNLTPKLKARGWWGEKNVVDPVSGETVKARLGSPRRLRTIYWANVRTARAAGQWERIQNTVSILPFLSYELGPAEFHRPHHADKKGIVLPATDPFWNEWFAPNGWGCKCWHRQIGEPEARRLGISKAPRVPRVTHKNARTGEITTTPRGIDPGWNTNPGLARQRNAEKFLTGALERAPLEMGRIAVADLIRDPEFKAHIRGERLLALPIAILPKPLAVELGVKSRTILLSQDSAVRHSDPKAYPAPEVWAKISANIDKAEVWRETSTHLIFRIMIDGQIYRFVVKRTRDRKELWLKTFHRTSANKKVRGKKIKDGREE